MQMIQSLNPFTQIFLPIAVFLVMFALGTTLTLLDLKNVLRKPRGLIVGLCAHTFVLPLLAFGVAYILRLSAPMALGLVLIASCPANASVNVFTYLARGDTMLSVSLTAGASLLCVISIPLYLNIAFRIFPSAHSDVSFPVLPAAIGLFLVSTLPVLAGMFLRHKRPQIAKSLEVRMGKLGLVAILLVMGGAVWTAQSDILAAISDVGVPALLLNVLAVVFGWAVALGLGLSKPQQIAVGFECGLQNFALAAFVSLTLLNDAALLMPAVAYGLTMWISAFALLIFARRAALMRRLSPAPKFPSV
jgi:BASS family bile acid:Na+ symporter